MKKRLLSTLLALSMVLALLPGTAWAEDAESNLTMASERDVPEVQAVSGVIDSGTLDGYGIQWVLSADHTLTIGWDRQDGDGRMPDYRDYTSWPWYQYRKSITKVVLEEGISYLDSGAFRECAATSISLPSSLTRLGRWISGAADDYNPFSNCPNLEEIIVNPSNSTYASIGGVLFLKDIFMLASYPCGRSGAYSIPDGVVKIGAGSFANCDSLTDITIPDSVITIGSSAFYNCTNLSKIVVPDSVTSIGQTAFNNCASATDITISNRLTSIEHDVFAGCESVTSVVIPDNVTRIYSGAFHWCTSLRSIFIPKSVTSFVWSGGMFMECPELTDIYYGGSREEWMAIEYATNNTSEDGNLYTIQYDNDYRTKTATIHYNCVAGDAPAPQMYKVYCNGSFEPFTKSLEECLANRVSSSAYNPELAHMLIAMCNSIYNPTDMRETFKSFGFEQKNWFFAEGPYLNYATAQKELSDGESLVLVVVRGTGELFEDLTEWLSNANVDTNDRNQHQGFADATDDLYDVIIEGLKLDGESVDLGKIKFVITGFSRGAAVTNLLAERLLRNGAAKNNLYAYAFACPDTVKSASDLRTGYECIYNIADVNDLVSWVPDSLWFFDDNWNKYGQSYWFSNDWDDYENLKMVNILTLGNAHDQTKYLRYLSDEKTIAEYKLRSEAKRALDYAAEWRDNKFWNDVQNNILSFVGFHCPVDVEIYTSGRLVGSITSNLVQINDGSKIYISVIDDEKNIYLLDDDTYTFNLTATGEGTMEYIVQNIDVGTKNVIDEQVFENIALTINKEFTTTVMVEENVAVDVKTKAIKLYVVDSGGEPKKEVLPDGKGTEVPIDTSDDPDNTYTITLNANGGIVNSANLTTGIDGKLTSLPTPTRDGYTFDGWYTSLGGGKKITTNTKFEEDTTVYAHWTQNSEHPTPTTYTITFNANGGTVTPTTLTSDTSGKLSNLPTPTRSGYTFNGWFTAPSGGTRVTTTSVFTENTTIYAQWTDSSSSGDNSSGGNTYPSDNTSGGSSSPTTYGITAPAVTGGTISVSPKSASKGATVTITATPDTGCELVSVTALDSSGKTIALTDKGNGKYTFTMPSGKVTVNAVFQPIQPNEPEPETPWSNPFTDISESEWYYEAVRFVQENGLMSGYGDGIFAPNANLSRAMLAQILYNKEGRPTVTESAFTDVTSDAWYSDAVTWAAEQGIVSGYGNGLFGPGDNITREQLAVMLWRYTGAPAATDKELHFTDADTASGYAVDALRWATENGIINGKGGGILDPKGLATRAQVAQMLMNYLKK